MLYCPFPYFSPSNPLLYVLCIQHYPIFLPLLCQLPTSLKVTKWGWHSHDKVSTLEVSLVLADPSHSDSLLLTKPTMFTLSVSKDPWWWSWGWRMNDDIVVQENIQVSVSKIIQGKSWVLLYNINTTASIHTQHNTHFIHVTPWIHLNWIHIN